MMILNTYRGIYDSIRVYWYRRCIPQQQLLNIQILTILVVENAETRLNRFIIDSLRQSAQKSIHCEFLQKTAYKHIISSLRKVRHKEQGPSLALLNVINNMHCFQGEKNHNVYSLLKKIHPSSLQSCTLLIPN